MPGTFSRPLASCASDGSRVAYGEATSGVDAGPVTMSGVSVRIPGPPEFADERVIRPALFVLFRIALGPSADYYGPRFLAFERAGRAMAGWHWPALFAPPVWAFYRRLWGAGLFFTALPLAGAATMALVAPWLGDHTWVWIACAILLTVLLPGIRGGACCGRAEQRRERSCQAPRGQRATARGPRAHRHRPPSGRRPRARVGTRDVRARGRRAW